MSQKIIHRIAFAALAALLVAKPAFAGTFRSDDLRMQFESPSGWTVSEPAPGHVSLLPILEEARSRQGVGMSIGIEEAYEVELPADLAGVRNYFIAYMQGGRPYTIVSETDITVAGYPAKQIMYTGEFEGISGPARHASIFVFGPSGWLYNIRYSALETVFDKYWQEARVALDTLQFTG